jgi:predicted small metal-binding protein
MRKIIKCECGFLIQGDNDNELVANGQQHAREHHKLDLSREQLLSMATPA